MTSSATDLGGRAARLSSELYSLQERCNHVTTSSEISSIADELARLSTALWHLHEAMNADPHQYTPAFNQDLAEITTELTLIFEEISECCSEMQKADALESPVPWFFKKGRVARLTKHLEVLKGTLSVMRTVLRHGREYGTQNSPGRLVESYPHTMHEDRVILESILARNRNAILDLHELESAMTKSHSDNVNSHTQEISDGSIRPDFSLSTGVEIPPIPDVLPTVTDETANVKQRDKLARTFSKRGVRLGVHMSILDLNAHEAPLGLKKKWIQQSRLRAKGDVNSSVDSRGLTALPELSKISEVDTEASRVNLQDPSRKPSNNPSIPNLMPVQQQEPTTTWSESRGYRRNTAESSFGKNIKNAIRRLSITSIRTQKAFGQGANLQSRDSSKDSKDESSIDAGIHRQGTNQSQKSTDSKKPGFIQVVSKPFQPQSPLNTPDVEKEFENGFLA